MEAVRLYRERFLDQYWYKSTDIIWNCELYRREFASTSVSSLHKIIVTLGTVAVNPYISIRQIENYYDILRSSAIQNTLKQYIYCHPYQIFCIKHLMLPDCGFVNGNRQCHVDSFFSLGYSFDEITIKKQWGIDVISIIGLMRNWYRAMIDLMRYWHQSMIVKCLMWYSRWTLCGFPYFYRTLTEQQ